MSSDHEGASAVSVLIATPRPVLAEGLRLLLTELNWSPLKLVKQLARVAKSFKREQPALILIDCDWPKDDVFPALAALQALQSTSKIVLLFETLQAPLRFRALLAGCTAIIDYRQSAEQLRGDLLQIAALPQPQPWGELGRLYQYLVHPVEKLAGCENLTTRESQVLRLLGWGLSNEEIARALQLSVETVKEHLRNLFKKMSFTDRTQAAVWAVRHGMVDFTT
jgi:DNA-binding NarL/FixJ family response regulator